MKISRRMTRRERIAAAHCARLNARTFVLHRRGAAYDVTTYGPMWPEETAGILRTFDGAPGEVRTITLTALWDAASVPCGPLPEAALDRCLASVVEAHADTLRECFGPKDETREAFAAALHALRVPVAAILDALDDVLVGRALRLRESKAARAERLANLPPFPGMEVTP